MNNYELTWNKEKNRKIAKPQKSLKKKKDVKVLQNGNVINDTYNNKQTKKKISGEWSRPKKELVNWKTE